jgi:hypothetical protein
MIFNAIAPVSLDIGGTQLNPKSLPTGRQANIEARNKSKIRILKTKKYLPLP